MSEVNYDQLGRYLAKRIVSLDNLEVLRSMMLYFDEQGDAKAVRVLDRCIEIQYGARVHLGMMLELRMGGMDRKGI